MILAFDLATQTGYAVGAKAPTMGHRRLARSGSASEEAGAGLVRLMQELVAEYDPELIVFERPIRRLEGLLERKKGGNQANTKYQTVYKLGGLAYVCGTMAQLWGIPYKSVDVNAARRTFLGYQPGKGQGKVDVQRGCALRGWVYQNDDESDAACIWASVARDAAGSPLFAFEGKHEKGRAAS